MDCLPNGLRRQSAPPAGGAAIAECSRIQVSATPARFRSLGRCLPSPPAVRRAGETGLSRRLAALSPADQPAAGDIVPVLSHLLRVWRGSSKPAWGIQGFAFDLQTAASLSPRVQGWLRPRTLAGCAPAVGVDLGGYLSGLSTALALADH